MEQTKRIEYKVIVDISAESFENPVASGAQQVTQTFEHELRKMNFAADTARLRVTNIERR